jgi:phosphotransferase system HPr (HPr) family protein
MVSRRILIINRLGLHARAAAQLVRLASTFKCGIKLIRDDNSSVIADAKSILRVLTLAAGMGVELHLETEGADEDAAAEKISQMFADGFGEL